MRNEEKISSGIKPRRNNSVIIVDLSHPRVVVREGRISDNCPIAWIPLAEIDGQSMAVAIVERAGRLVGYFGEEASQYKIDDSNVVKFPNLASCLGKIHHPSTSRILIQPIIQTIKQYVNKSQIYICLPFESSGIIRREFRRVLKNAHIRFKGFLTDIFATLFFFIEERLNNQTSEVTGESWILFIAHTSLLKVCVFQVSLEEEKLEVEFDNFMQFPFYTDYTENQISDFVEPFLKSSERSLRFIVLGDKQEADSQNAIFEACLRQGIRPVEYYSYLEIENQGLVFLVERLSGLRPLSQTILFHYEMLLGVQVNSEKIFPLANKGTSPPFETRLALRLKETQHLLHFNLYASFSDHVDSGFHVGTIEIFPNDAKSAELVVGLKWENWCHGKWTVFQPGMTAEWDSFHIPLFME